MRGLVVSSVALWALLLFNLLLTLALVRRVNIGARAATDRPSEGLAPGRPAPSFVAETLLGEPVTLADYAGRAVVFLFIGTHCPPCRSALPGYEALGAKAALAGVEFVLVSVDEAVQTRAFVAELGIRLPVIVAPHRSNPFAQEYDSLATPSYCLIDAHGTVQSAGYPSLDWGKWKALAESWEAAASPSRMAGLASGREEVSSDTRGLL